MRSIGEVSNACGVSQHLLRQWEDAGLLSPQRSRGQRRYSDLDVRLVRFIQRGRELGMGLGELREMFAIRDVAERTAVLQRRKKLLEDRIALAQQELAFVERGLECPHPDYRTCPDLAEIVQQPIRR
ncbi:MerR family transcriptional regulator [Cryptosporangium arvum]|jgi:DNA-binding transcriptional MerR regulator|uniref:Putative transcriptional regulator n=1 Tax=Cryptosporangium arvum DSM 44712 TaxID=927661 RepID=A0A010YJN9_9ACTN|nr:MerR family transcriptional regulator [Cryptosporangium arvum]EXG80455.1 putative transcriptional regulator [Cryptosporangium arvum DSM 44712]